MSRAAPGMSTATQTSAFDGQRIAVLVPCFNEEASIARVVADFRAALPAAEIYVYDNNSTDRTIELARAAGALVRREAHQGKGNVVRRMFSDVDADVYVLVDGDATYDAASAGGMIERLLEGRLDMVVAARVDPSRTAYRLGHRTGNRLLTGFFCVGFPAHAFTDILSGFRVFSRRFVKSFPVLSRGFEIETELAVHALELELPVAEMPTPYYARPTGSVSKLHTWRDGMRILATILSLYRSERPLIFFSAHRHVARECFDHPGHSNFRDVFRGRNRAAVSYGDFVYGADAASVHLDCRGPRARYGDARAAGSQADRLSAAEGAGRTRRPAPLAVEETCASLFAPMMLCWSRPSSIAECCRNPACSVGSEHERAGGLDRHPAAANACRQRYAAAARRLLEEAGYGPELRPDAP